MSEIAYVESGKTYIVEVPGYVHLQQAKSMIEALEAGANGARFIIMDGGAKLARLAGEAEKAIQRVRELLEEWEVNCQRRLTTEVQPYERYQAHFAKELREALDGNDDD